MLGAKIVNIMENGNIIKCMEEERLNGLMEESMMDNTRMIKSMVVVLFIGQMVGNTLEDGRMGSNMAKVSITFKMVRKR